jgi:hypothetical protein
MCEYYEHAPVAIIVTDLVFQTYQCLLCPIDVTPQEMIEPPKVSHKKKTDREREKERLEKEWALKKAEEYKARQRERGKPEIPREPLKRTADGNWVHIQCAVWTPETKFSNASTFDVVEGIGSNPLRHHQICKICKGDYGACVQCHHCHANFHVGCAFQAGYTFGFDVTPVKGSRRDSISTFTLGNEIGSVTAAIWCKEHSVKTIVHPLYEDVGEGLTAMQLYVRGYKQADTTLTGTARRANLVDQSTKGTQVPVTAPAANRRTSTTTQARTGRGSIASITNTDAKSEDGETDPPERQCAKCNIDVTPKWWPVEDIAASKKAVKSPTINSMINGFDHSSGHESVQNGVLDHDQPMPDAAHHPLSVPIKYLCQKCHWKKVNEPAEPDKPPTPESVPPSESQQLPVRSPTSAQSLPRLPWPPASHSPREPWASFGPPPIANGISQHSPQIPPPVQSSHSQPYHSTAHHQPRRTTANGTWIGTPQLHSIPPAVAPFAVGNPSAPGSTGPPAPLHLSSALHSGSSHSNGIPSPSHQMPIHSPTHPPQRQYPSLPPSRHSESPYQPGPALPPFQQMASGPSTGPSSVSTIGGSHQSPPPSNSSFQRPTTPRDEPPKSAGGASASPSLRNLLH